MKDFFSRYKIQLIITGGIIIAAALILAIFQVVQPDHKKTASAKTEQDSDEKDTQDPQPENLENESGAEIDAQSLNAGINDYETTGLTYGIDVSKWQGAVDWSKVKAAGIEYAIIRAGYRTEGKGTICEDEYARYNLQEANKAGIQVGVYFFSTAVSTAEAEEEAAWITDFIGKYSITYPVVYNCEGFNAEDSRMHGLTKTQRTNNALVFLQYIADKGYTPMLYAASSELTDSKYWDTSKITSKYKIWAAQYSGSEYTTGAVSSYTGTHAMWQYTNKGILDGINGYVDMNIAYFGYSVAAQPKDTSSAQEVTLPVQQTTAYNPYQDTNDQVTAKEETNLRTMANSADDSAIVYKLKNGEFLPRTAIGTNGWSKVVYNGQTLYALTRYLTTSSETTTTPQETTTAFSPFTDKSFTDVNEQVTSKDETALRSVPNTKGNDPVYTLKNGEYVTRTGIDPNTNWSRVVYNGQTLYAVSSLLKKDGE